MLPTYPPSLSPTSAHAEQQAAFKRELPEQVKHIQQAHPQAEVELWCMDEHRIGLKPVIRRVWMLKGHRPIMRVQQRYEWLYVYGFAHPESGDTHWLLLPSVNVEVFTNALEQFAQAVGAGPDRRIILVLDRARWHSSQTLVVPDGIHLVFLPPYSPELQRGFRLWPLSNEAIAHRHFKTLDELRRGYKHNAVSPESPIRSVSVTSLSSIGGLPRPRKRDLSGSNPLFPQTPLFVSFTSLRDISLRS